MITCPWCGTSYLTFQSNCSNCGGPLPPAESAPETGALTEPPPPPPRTISRRYIWRVMLADGWSIGAGVFLILGGVFTLVGLGLTIAIITAFVGLPFLGLGVLFLALGLPAFIWRYNKAQQKWDVLRRGVSTQGQITGLRQNLAVSVNGRHPWIIEYRFQVAGRVYRGQTTSLNAPPPRYKPGQTVYVLYLADDPQHNTVYPNPDSTASQ